MISRRKTPLVGRISTDDEYLSMRLSAAWAVLRQEHISVFFVSSYFLLEYLKLDQAYPIFSFLPLIKIFLVAGIVSAVIDKKSRFSLNGLTVLFFLFCLHCALSSAFAYSPQYSFDNLNIVFSWMIVYALITSTINSQKRIFIFLCAFVLANFKMSQFGFFSSAARGFSFASYGLTGAGWFRNSGELGLEMAIFLVFLAPVIFVLKRRWNNARTLFAYLTLLTAFVCVIESSSRGALLALLGALLYFLIFSRKKIRMFLFAAAFIGTTYALIPAQMMARILSSGHDVTSETRILYWHHAMEMAHRYPLLGVGYFNWIPYYTDHYFDPTAYWRVEVAHNTYLQMAAEIGYPGLMIFCMMIVAAFFFNLQSARLSARNQNEFFRAVSIGANAAGAALVIGAFFLTAAVAEPFFWTHFALSVCIRQSCRAQCASLIETAPREHGRLIR